MKIYLMHKISRKNRIWNNPFHENQGFQKIKGRYWAKIREKKNFWNHTLALLASTYQVSFDQSVRLGLMVYVSLTLKRTKYNFRNTFPPKFAFICRAEYIFPRNIFCYMYLKLIWPRDNVLHIMICTFTANLK